MSTATHKSRIADFSLSSSLSALATAEGGEGWGDEAAYSRLETLWLPSGGLAAVQRAGSWGQGGFGFLIRSLTIFLTLLCSASLRAQTSPTAFEEANKLYYENKFTEAAAAYEKLLASGAATPALYFNLGNAWFKSGQLGRAIAAYHQAESFTPRDPDVRANLRFARNQAQGPTLSVGFWERWLAKLTLNEWTFLALSPVWLWLLLATALQWRPAWSRGLRGCLGGLGIAAAVLCGCLAAAIYETRGVRTAVVISPEVVVRSGPLEESKSAFTLHDGAELRVLDRKDDWLMITTDPRRIGWLRRDQVLLASK